MSASREHIKKHVGSKLFQMKYLFSAPFKSHLHEQWEAWLNAPGVGQRYNELILQFGDAMRATFAKHEGALVAFKEIMEDVCAISPKSIPPHEFFAAFFEKYPDILDFFAKAFENPHIEECVRRFSERIQFQGESLLDDWKKHHASEKTMLSSSHSIVKSIKSKQAVRMKSSDKKSEVKSASESPVVFYSTEGAVTCTTKEYATYITMLKLQGKLLTVDDLEALESPSVNMSTLLKSFFKEKPTIDDCMRVLLTEFHDDIWEKKQETRKYIGQSRWSTFFKDSSIPKSIVKYREIFPKNADINRLNAEELRRYTHLIQNSLFTRKFLSACPNMLEEVSRDYYVDKFNDVTSLTKL